MTGKSLGRYELLEQLGEGGMGAVWLARLSGSGGFEKLCIVKTVLPSIATDAEFVSRFLHEGRVLTQLSHGNIAQVLDMNEADGQLFLALEYIAGVDLSRLHSQVRARQEFMPAALVVALIAQAAEGLGSAHRKHALDGTALNIVHRDVSPQNIMVSYEGEVKVIDFGIARSEARSRNTSQASVMGKLGYMAPEQARGEHVDHRADQYALGIVLWELLSNEAFVRRGTLTEMVVAMATPMIRPLSPVRPDVPAALEAVVLKALAPLPEGRFADTDAFAQALTAQLHSLGSTPTKPQLGEYVRAVCATQYQSQQVLLSRVATIRSPTGHSPAAVAAALADTSMQPGTPEVARKVDTGALTSPARPRVVSQLAAEAPVATPAEKLEATFVPASSHGTPAVARREPSTDPAVPLVPELTVPQGSAAVAPTPERSAPGTEPLGSPRVADRLTTSEIAAATGKRSPVALVLVGLVVVLLIAVALSFRGGAEVTAVVDAGVPIAAAPILVDAGHVETAPVPVEVAPAPVDAGIADVDAEEPSLRVSVRQAGGGSWILTNQNRTTWTNCEVTVPGQRTAKVASVPRSGSVEVANSKFHVDPTARRLVKQLRIDCAQGFGLVPVH